MHTPVLSMARELDQFFWTICPVEELSTDCLTVLPIQLASITVHIQRMLVQVAEFNVSDLVTHTHPNDNVICMSVVVLVMPMHSGM